MLNFILVVILGMYLVSCVVATLSLGALSDEDFALHMKHLYNINAIEKDDLDSFLSDQKAFKAKPFAFSVGFIFVRFPYTLLYEAYQYLKGFLCRKQ